MPTMALQMSKESPHVGLNLVFLLPGGFICSASFKGTSTRITRITPVAFPATSFSSALSADTMNRVQPSSPPSAQAYVPWPTSTRSVTSPPSRTRATPVPDAFATQIAPSASRVHPSGVISVNCAQTRRFSSVPSGRMSNAVYRRPNDSPTIRRRPSGVITLPFGNSMSSAATSTVPSGRTSASAAFWRVPRAQISKPKLPT